MASKDLTLGEAARAIGVSADTLRRWERAGKLRTKRDASNRRLPAKRSSASPSARSATAPATGYRRAIAFPAWSRRWRWTA